MDLRDVALRGIYRYEDRDVIVIARLPGYPSEDDPTGPSNGDAVMVKYVSDDHKFIIDPADLESMDHGRCEALTRSWRFCDRPLDDHGACDRPYGHRN